MDSEDKNSLKRGLKTRHLTMIAIGGSIGTGLFLASGGMISIAGPGGVLLSYILVGILIYWLMNGLGEMSTYNPVTGSVMTFAKKYVDSALGFSIGWIYYYMIMAIIVIDVTSLGIIMNFWFPNTSTWIFSTILFSIIIFLNFLGSNSYGESEFWMSLIKVIAIIIFIIIGLLIILGLIGSESIGLKNFFYGGGPFIGNINSFFSVLVLGALSFAGVELIGVTAGETKNPSKSIPKAINSLLLRILIFYIGTTFVMGAIIPYTSPYLLNAETNVAISPFALIFKYANIPAADSIINFIILIALISACNSMFYASTRVLYALGKENFAPKKFTLANKKGIPYFSIIITILTLPLSILISLIGHNAYLILISGTGISALIVWAGLGIAYYRFRRGYIKQGFDLNKLEFKSKLFPLGPIIVIFGTISMIGYNLISTFFTDWITAFYLSIPVILFFILLISYKFHHKTKLIPLNKINLK
jgi:lysine-specific permease